MKNRLIRRPEVLNLVGLSRATIYLMMAEGRFPKPVKVGLR
jgi:prophage regulatory protein